MSKLQYGPGTGGAYTSEKQRARRSRPNKTTRVITASQREIMSRIVEGQSRAQIAEEMGVSRQTVRVQLSNVRNTLGLDTDLKAGQLLDAAGLLADPAESYVVHAEADGDGHIQTVTDSAAKFFAPVQATS